MKKRAFVLFASFALGGCALASKGTALDIRYFNPEAVKPTLTNADVGSRKVARSIELGRVTSGVHLREKIAYRDSAHEIGYYDDRRWTERPEVYVRRELARTLFEERGMRRALDGRAPVLEVEVLAFEEIRGPAPRARIALRLVVHDDHESLLEKTIVVDRPITRGGFVQAMAEALVASTEQVATEAEAVLAAWAPTGR